MLVLADFRPFTRAKTVAGSRLAHLLSIVLVTSRSGDVKLRRKF